MSPELDVAWNDHHSTIVGIFEKLLDNCSLVDCTIAAEGQYVKAHKLVLSACSPYFEMLFKQENEKNPIVILKDTKFQELKAIIDFVYRGKVKISKDRLQCFIDAAESLQIKGLEGDPKKNDLRKRVNEFMQDTEGPVSSIPDKRRRTRRRRSSSSCSSAGGQNTGGFSPGTETLEDESNCENVTHNPTTENIPQFANPVPPPFSGNGEPQTVLLETGEQEELCSAQTNPTCSVVEPTERVVKTESDHEHEFLETEALFLVEPKLEVCEEVPEFARADIVGEDSNVDGIGEEGHADVMGEVGNVTVVQEKSTNQSNVKHQYSNSGMKTILDSVPGSNVQGHQEGASSSFKKALKKFKDSILEAREQGVDPQTLDVIEKGFLMTIAEMDSLRNIIQYDVSKGSEKINYSMAFSGITSSLSLDDMKVKFNTPLPIKDLEVFEAFDAQLDNTEKNKDCVNLIKSIVFGARNENDAIHSTMAKFMAKELQVQFSGRGRKIKGKGKKDFSATKLCSITLDILMPHFRMTKDALLAKISRWLAGAPDREGGRKVRENTDE